MIKVSPSILSADFADMGKDIEMIDSCGADLIHCDVMDGQFVPNMSFGPIMVQAIRKHTKKPLDVHLMIDAPERYIDNFADAGADIITVHYEATNHPHRALNYIRSKGIKSGIAFNPGTDITGLEYLLDSVDLILIMTVNPGFGGQKFIPEMLKKIEKTKKLVGDRDIMIEVDGGIDEKTAKLAIAAGADTLVAGSSVFGAPNRREMIDKLKKS